MDMLSYLELSVTRVTFVFSLSLHTVCGLLGRSPAAAAALRKGMRPSPQRRSRSLRAAHRPLRRQSHPWECPPVLSSLRWGGGNLPAASLGERVSGAPPVPCAPRYPLWRQTPARSGLARSQRCRDRIRSFLFPVAQTSSTDLKRRRLRRPRPPKRDPHVGSVPSVPAASGCHPAQRCE